MSIKICLNAGHDGKYNRSPGVPEYYESDMNWKLHIMLKEELENRGFVVKLNRASQETKMGLVQRGRASKGCNLFLSIHSNAVGSQMDETVDRPVGIYFVDDDCGPIDERSKALAKLLSDEVAEVMQTRQKAQIYSRLASNDLDGDGERNDDYYSELWGAHQVDVPGVILEHSFHTNTRAAKWLLEEENLRKLAIAEADVLADYFGAEDKPELTGYYSTGSAADEKIIWDFLKGKGLNDFAIAGIMGNLYAEAAFRSNNLQNTGEKALKLTDAQYTARIDAGERSFIDGHGYGIAQWTYPTRKEDLLAYAREQSKSIGDLYMQLDFLWLELNKDFKNVVRVLQNAESVKEASDIMLTGYEKPANQTEENKDRRASHGQRYYDKYAEVHTMEEEDNTTDTTVETKKGDYTMEMRNLKRGCKGEDVKALQILLIGRGYSCGDSGVDGSYGPATRSAVRNYQKAKGLEVDGVAGKNTMSSLLGV